MASPAALDRGRYELRLTATGRSENVRGLTYAVTATEHVVMTERGRMERIEAAGSREPPQPTPFW